MFYYLVILKRKESQPNAFILNLCKNDLCRLILKQIQLQKIIKYTIFFLSIYIKHTLYLKKN